MDLKAKFLAMKNTFELVVNGTDEYDIRRSRLDSVLGICEEITFMILDSKSDIYNSAHLCIDLVYLYMTMHLSMLEMSISTFKMKDHKMTYQKYSQHYPLIITSYIEKAMSNYITPIVLNYHNQYSTFRETEEIYYELTKSVIYKTNKNKSHNIWPSNVAEMAKDNMFYSFSTYKLEFVEPVFMVGAISPLLTRALRYGM